jgi:hypothetical protein
MPKDLIHFAVAERTAARLAATRYAPSLAPGHGLLLGAVFHDALFYATPPGGVPLERLAHRLHGADGEDTFTLIRIQAEHAAEAETLLARSLLVGMVSHLYADAVMHPLVWHLSGDYYSPIPAEKTAARQRHRALEALMDMLVCPGMLGRSRYSLRLMLRRCPRILDGLPMARLGSMASMTPSAATSALGRAWATYAIFQAAYSNRLLARTAYTLRPALPGPAAELAALFYAPRQPGRTHGSGGGQGRRTVPQAGARRLRLGTAGPRRRRAVHGCGAPRRLDPGDAPLRQPALSPAGLIALSSRVVALTPQIH